jgi:HEAT repeat protein
MLVAACLETLAEIGDPATLAIIRRALPDLAALPEYLLVPCIKALATLGTSREFVDLASLVPLQSGAVLPGLLAAIMAIHQRCIHRRCAPPEPPANALLALRNIVESDESPVCRYRATRVLGFWADYDDVLAFLKASQANPESAVRQGATEALLALDRSKAGEPS